MSASNPTPPLPPVAITGAGAVILSVVIFLSRHVLGARPGLHVAAGILVGCTWYLATLLFAYLSASSGYRARVTWSHVMAGGLWAAIMGGLVHPVSVTSGGIMGGALLYGLQSYASQHTSGSTAAASTMSGKKRGKRSN